MHTDDCGMVAPLFPAFSFFPVLSKGVLANVNCSGLFPYILFGWTQEKVLCQSAMLRLLSWLAVLWSFIYEQLVVEIWGMAYWTQETVIWVMVGRGDHPQKWTSIIQLTEAAHLFFFHNRRAQSFLLHPKMMDYDRGTWNIPLSVTVPYTVWHKECSSIPQKGFSSIFSDLLCHSHDLA